MRQVFLTPRTTRPERGRFRAHAVFSPESRKKDDVGESFDRLEVGVQPDFITAEVVKCAATIPAGQPWGIDDEGGRKRRNLVAIDYP